MKEKNKIFNRVLEMNISKKFISMFMAFVIIFTPTYIPVKASNAWDFTNKITSITTEKLQNGSWVPSTDFKDGDNIKVSIKYSLDKNYVSNERPTIYYQLPKGVKILEKQEGRVTSKGKYVGSYNIGTDGKIEITFNKEFLSTDAGIDGEINFEGLISKSEAGNSGKISFPGTNTTVNIIIPKPPEESKTDIKTEKEGKLSDDKRTINYTVTISTQKGTNENIHIEDEIPDWNFKNINVYQYQDINIKKVFSNGGTQTLNSNQYKLNWKDDNKGFSIENLDKLDPGQKYQLTYSVQVTPKDTNAEIYKLNNNIYARSGNDEDHTSNYIQWHKNNIKKTGSYDPKTGMIAWTIEINPDKKDITGWTFQDYVYSKIHGPVYIRQEGKEDVQMPQNFIYDYFNSGGYYIIQYRFNPVDEQAKRAKYSIIYYTIPTDEQRQIGQVQNTGEVNGESSTAIVKITKRVFGIEKGYRESDLVNDSESLLKNKWNINVDLPEGNLSKFTVEDTIENAKDEKGKDLGPDSHYAIASELDQIFKSGLYIHESETSYVDKKNINIEIKYYDKDQREVTANNSSTKVKSFKISVEAKPGHQYKAKYFRTTEYYTYTDLSKASANAMVTFHNKAKVANVENIGKGKYKKVPRLAKGIYKGKSDDDLEIYDYENSQISYDKFKGKLTYRIMLKTKQSDDKKTISLTDFLPKGAELSGSIKTVFYQDQYNEYDTNYVEIGGNNHKYYSLKANTSHRLVGNKLNIKIMDYRYREQYPNIAIYYTLDISKDKDWLDINRLEKKYTNKVSWGSDSSEIEAQVKKDPKKIDKNGIQLAEDGSPLIGSDGKPIQGKKPSNKIRYSIVINPRAEDLDINSKTIKLVDRLKQSDALAPRVDVSSIKLYKFDINKPGKKGTLVDSSEYGLTLKPDDFELSLTIPDERAFILEYEYSINPNLGVNTSISNEVTLNSEWTSDDKISIYRMTSSATATKKVIKIYKVDEDNFNKFLPNTKFKLEYYNKSKKQWSIKTKEIVVNQRGYIQWNLSGSDRDLEEDTLYRLIETDSIEGYKKLDKAIHFIWTGSHGDNNRSYYSSGASQASNINNGENYIPKQDILIFANSGAIHYITNKYTRLSVNKVWLDEEGKKMAAPSEKEVKLNLYKNISKPDGHEIKLVMQNYGKDQIYKFYVNKSTKKGITIELRGLLENPKVTFSNDKGTFESKEVGLDQVHTIKIDYITQDNIITLNDNSIYPTPRAFNYDKAPIKLIESSKVGNTITLSKNNNWIHSWDNLDLKDSKGNDIFYTVKEEKIQGYETSYSNNEGVQIGNINVINKKEKVEEFELPHTGSYGRGPIYTTGIALLILAFIIYMKNMKKVENF